MIKRFYQEKLHLLPLFWFVIKKIHRKWSAAFLFTWTNNVFFIWLCVFLHKWTLKMLKRHQSCEGWRLNMPIEKRLKNMKKCKNFQRTHVKWGSELYKKFFNCQLFWIISTIFDNERIQKKNFFWNFTWIPISVANLRWLEHKLWPFLFLICEFWVCILLSF